MTPVDLRDRREALGLSQEALAERLDVSRNTIARWERGELRAGLLYRLPEWCVYVETPGRTLLGAPLHGIYAHLEWDANTGRTELRFVFDMEGLLLPLPVHMVEGGLEAAVAAMTAESS